MQNILVVEDQTNLLKLITKMLDSLGYTSIQASGPQQALSIAHEYANKGVSIDLLLTDIILEGINGFELFEKIDKIFPDINCLFMSGYTSEYIKNMTKGKGPIDFLKKPFHKFQLAEKVHQAFFSKKSFS